MPYTLAKGLFWFVLAVLLGVVIGWLLHQLVARREARRCRVIQAEMNKCRARVRELESIVDERDRLAAQKEALTSERDRLLARLGQTPPATSPTPEIAEPVDDESQDAVEPVEESEDVEPVATDDQVAASGDDSGDDEPESSTAQPAEDDQPVIDLSAAAEILGRPVRADDLTVVEGIGPKIAELCHGIGIHTWADLGSTEVSLLKTMLVDAGPRFRPHDPGTWPDQAKLLAAGQWKDFVRLTDSLRGGR
ncbi:MAG: hypothetical protein CSA55_04735 [Ilumatobacter coccineus]|uniref:DUF4332 domain-containing protein n=1 Tax=Ilumatobacter coccineus TaxID=467094 RepID=A0A2G6K866_9ACTN|nr:MAG: hypothetical protein CSA55_04735 [Ilumatobacter coccineus]